MKIGAWLVAALAAGLVASCGKQPAQDAGQGQSGAEATRDAVGEAQDRAAAADAGNDASSGTAGSAGSAASDSVFAPLLDDVERARGVQQTVDEQAERLRKEIEKAEGAGQ
jgi:hypothetical protein